jgi:ribosomal protein S18 acetylase RimI-like enzyme
MDNATITLAQLRDSYSQPLLDQFIALYNDAFPDPSEREDPEQWRERLCNELAAPQPRLFLALAITGDAAMPRVIAGLAFEYYRDSNCGLLTYLVVDTAHRGQGLARRLADEAVATLRRQAGARRLDGVFSEVEDPAKVDEVPGLITPAERLRVMARLGARWVDIPYVQPQLIGGSGRSHHLLLLTFPLDGHLPQAASVRAFLHEFYRALAVPAPDADVDVDFIKMDAALNTNFQCGCFELPMLKFDNAGVALHFVEYKEPVLKRRRSYRDNSSAAFHSMEMDLLAYQFQEQPPIGSRHYGACALPVTITFPPTLTVFSTSQKSTPRNCSTPSSRRSPIRRCSSASIAVPYCR